MSAEMESLTRVANEAAKLLGLKLPKVTCHESEALFVLLNSLDALKRSRDIAVLDAWAERTARMVSPHPFRNSPESPFRVFGMPPHIMGETPDEARAVAARAIEAGEV